MQTAEPTDLDPKWRDLPTLVCVGDIHGARRRLEAAVRWIRERPCLLPDLVLLTGDFAGRRGSARPGQRELDAALRALAPLPAPIVYVPGNHDARALEDRSGGALPADRRLVRAGGLRIWGLGGAPTKAGLPYEWSDRELQDLDPPDFDVFLSHAPPAGTALDTLPDGTHVGSRSVRRIARSRPSLVVCGHIHEAAGAATLGHSVCYNAGSLGPPHGAAQVGIVRLDPAEGSVRIDHRFPGRSRGWRWEGRVGLPER